MEWVALGALLLSLGNTAWQVVVAVRRRKRLVVSVAVATASEPTGHGTRITIPLLVVEAHALNGAIGIRDIDFELKPEPDGYGWREWVSEGENPGMPLHTSHPALQEGATAAWKYRFTQGADFDLRAMTEITAVFVLTDGSRIRADPVTVVPPQEF